MTDQNSFRQCSPGNRAPWVCRPSYFVGWFAVALIWITQAAAAPLYVVVLDPTLEESPAVQGTLDVFLEAIEREGWEFSEESRRISQRSDGILGYIGLTEVPISDSPQGFSFIWEGGKWSIQGSTPLGAAAGLVPSLAGIGSSLVIIGVVIKILAYVFGLGAVAVSRFGSNGLAPKT